MRLLSPPRRPSAVFAFLAAVVLAGWNLFAAAAPAPAPDNPGLLIETIARGAEPPELRLRGNWATECLPSIDAVILTGRDLRIELHASKSLCARVTRPFDVRVDLAERLGRTPEPGVYRVSIYTSSGVEPGQQLRGFGLVEIGEPQRVRAESGFWWPDVTRDSGAGAAGTSVSFEIQGNRLAAALMGFAAEGEQAWYFGTGGLASRSATIDLVGMSGGSPLLDAGPANLAPNDNVSLWVDFESNARATIWFGRYERGDVQPKLRLRSIPLVRQPLASFTGPTSWEGDWVLLRDSASLAPIAERIRLVSAALLNLQQFRLAGDGFVLKCDRDPRPVQSLPLRCTLDSGDVPIAEFTSVGINRLDGRAADGSRIQLLRVDR